MSETTLWASRNGRYEIAQHGGKIMVIDNDRGINDWHFDRGYRTFFTARVLYSYPEWWPKYVKKEVERICSAIANE